MTESLRVGQFAIVDHEPVDRGPNAGVFHGKGPHDDRAELFIIAEGTTPAGESFAGHVVSAVGQAFGSLDMSLTGALRRLFVDAENNVRDWNERSLAQHRVNLGLSCFARRGGQTVLAQAGPTAAFHLSGKRMTIYVPDEEHARPIGSGAALPQLTRVPFEPGDRLLLITTPALAALDDEIIGGILSLSESDVLADLYHRLSHLRHLTAVLITTPDGPGAATSGPVEASDVIIDATSASDAPAAEPGDSFQPSLFIDDRGADAIDTARRQLLELRPRTRVEAAIPATQAQAPVPLQRVVGDGGFAILAAATRARAEHSRELVNAIGPAGIARPAWSTTPVRPAARASVDATAAGAGNGDVVRRNRKNSSFSRGLVREEARVNPTPVTTDAVPCDELAESTRIRTEAALAGPVSEMIAGQSVASVSSGGSLVRMRGNMGGRWKGNGGRGASVGSAQLPPTWLVILIGLGVLVTLVAFLVLPRAFDGDQRDRYSELVDGAQQQLAAAHALPDLGKKREALTTARAMLLEAREIDAATLAETGLMAEIDRELGAMDNVHTPQLVERIASLEQFGDKPVSVTRLAVNETSAYLLNAAGNQVIGVALATGEKQVVYEANKEARRGNPLALAWADASDFAGPALIVADNDRSVWAYAADGLRPLVFAAPASLQITDIATYEGDLYVLDAHDSVVYRFAQTAQGYSNAPTKLLETPDLAAARRLMVDGEVVTADANGTLRRFTNQTVLVLSQAGIDKPLLKDELAQPIEKRGDLAVLDATNDRIVVMRRDGTFDRQYKHKELHGMTAFVTRGGVAYVFAAGQLRRITW